MKELFLETALSDQRCGLSVAVNQGQPSFWSLPAGGVGGAMQPLHPPVLLVAEESACCLSGGGRLLGGSSSFLGASGPPVVPVPQVNTRTLDPALTPVETLSMFKETLERPSVPGPGLSGRRGQRAWPGPLVVLGACTRGPWKQRCHHTGLYTEYHNAGCADGGQG